MGTTITAAIVDLEAEEVAIGHVGDSRAYRLRGGKLERLTRDHSLVEEMRRKGQLTDAQAEDHPQRSIITRALGPEPEVEVDLQTVPAQAGDVFLLCSDGLTTMLGDEQIARLLAGATSMAGGGPGPGRRSQPGRRPRQHHRRRLPARGRGAARRPRARARGRDPDRRDRRGGGPDRDRGPPPRRRRGRAASAARSSPRSRGRRGLRTAAKVLAALAVLVAAVAFGAWYGNRQVWFLGTDDAGRVALYRGVPYELPFGIELYDERYASPIQTESLPPKRRDAVTGHDLRSREDAVSLVEDIAAAARGFLDLRPEPGADRPGSRSPSCSPPASPRSSPRRTPGSATSA